MDENDEGEDLIGVKLKNWADSEELEEKFELKVEVVGKEKCAIGCQKKGDSCLCENLKRISVDNFVDGLLYNYDTREPELKFF